MFQLLLQSVTADAAQSALLEIDSIFCKVPQIACSGLKNQAIRSSCGGNNTKVHVIINERMQLPCVVLTGGQIHDSQSALLANLLVIISKNAAQSYVSRINPTSIRNTISTPTCISDATLSNASFNVSRLFATSLLVSTNCPPAFSILSYLLLALFTFNLPTAPDKNSAECSVPCTTRSASPTNSVVAPSLLQIPFTDESDRVF